MIVLIIPEILLFGKFYLYLSRCLYSINPIVCKALILIPPKILAPPFFRPTPNLKNWFPPFVSETSEKFLRANLSNFRLTNRNHCENYHLCMMYTTKGYNVCCRRQIFEEIYGNLSLKVPIFVLFYP